MGWEKELRDAVCAKDTSTVNFILSRKEVRNGIGRDEWKCGEAPLHLAAHFGMNEMVRLFAEVGADINSTMTGDNGVQVSVLHFAVYGNQTETVKLLLELGADVNMDGKWNELTGTPLDFAHQRGYSDMYRILEDSKDQHSTVTAKSLQEMVVKIKSKPTMEEELDKAMEIQRKIKACEAQHRKLLEEKAKVEERINSFKLDPDYRNERQIQKLMKNLAEIQTLALALQDTCKVRKDSDSTAGAGKNCPVCFEAPDKVYNCLTCDNLICGSCKSKLSSCPSCRADFQVNPPKRNKTAEMFL